MSSRKIFKYRHKIEDFVTLPAGKLVHVAPQNLEFLRDTRMVGTDLTFWVEHDFIGDDPTKPVGPDLELQIVGTGNPILDGADHLQSVIDGPLVWHIYQIVRR